jgi:putative PIN family toxin of toxin-antitoxin system
MKVFFDTNVYVAEALLGGAAEHMVAATIAARWRILTSEYVLDETQRVLTGKFAVSQRFGFLTRSRARRRAVLVPAVPARHHVPRDPADSAVLSAAVDAGADLLVTNDRHLLAMNPCEGLRIISMTEYYDLLVNEGHIVT